jgi:hypothetical protein
MNFYQTALYYIPEDDILHSHYGGNLKPKTEFNHPDET